VQLIAHGHANARITVIQGHETLATIRHRASS
jgi:hypothetical protein